MSRLKALPLIACLSSLLLAAGCGDACLSLANEICSCQPDPNAQAICNAQAKAQDKTFPIGKADQQFCQQKLDSQACDCSGQRTTSGRAACCNKLNTAEGRAACGLVLTSP